MPLYPYKPIGDQPTVQARRTTAFTLSGSFADIPMDTTDVSNNPAIVEHDSGATERITVKITGNFRITYGVRAPAGVGLLTSMQVMKNSDTVLPGSELAGKSDATDEPPISLSFVAALTAGDYISIQAMASDGTPDLLAGLTVTIVHQAGEKGEKGDNSATDVNAIHVNAGEEISLISEKVTPTGEDIFVIEDSAAGYTKKRLKVGNIPSGTTLTSIAPVNVTKSTSAVGVGTEAARNDHKHDISTASAGPASVGDSASEGSATSLARSDHRHGFTAGTPVSVSTTNAAGTAASFSSSDHRHAGLTRDSNDFSTFAAKATPVDGDVLLIEDSAAGGAKKNVSISSIKNSAPPSSSIVSAVNTITTTSITYVLVENISVTPVAGTYLVWFSTSCSQVSNNQWVYMSIYAGNVQETYSEVGRQFNGADRMLPMSTQARVTVNGSQAIDARWRVSASTGSMFQRSLMILKVS